MDPRHHRASGGLLCSSQGCYDDCSGVGHKGPCNTENSCSTEMRTRPKSTVQDRSQDTSGLSLVDCLEATERFRSRIVSETEYGDAWVDKADGNSQSLAMYNATRKTTESEREAKDQIKEQAKKYARNEGTKVENEKLSVKTCLTKAICWSHAKSDDDAAEKYFSNYAKKAHAEAIQMIESVLETYEALPHAKEGASNQRKAREVMSFLLC